MMRASDLKVVIEELRLERASGGDSDIPAALDSLIDALDRFGDRPAHEFADALAKVKPKAVRKRASKKAFPAKANRKDVVEDCIAQLRAASGDLRATSEIVSRIRPGGAVSRDEAIEIAKALGVRTTSDTTKKSALSQIEGLSSQRERDRLTADRIARSSWK